MQNTNNIPWNEINDFLLDIGKIRDPRSFCVQMIEKIDRIIPYDQAWIFFMNENGTVYDEVSFGVEDRWREVYHEYYSKLQDGRFSVQMFGGRNRDSIATLQGNVYDWRNFSGSEFIADYIKPRGLTASAGYVFHNANHFIKTTYSIDRTNKGGFSEKEIQIMNIIQKHLDNLHINLFMNVGSSYEYFSRQELYDCLTRREIEIADLLCKGLTPEKISSNLVISLSTVYRHIANMHEKLEVSNRQELLLRLMSMFSKAELIERN